MKRFISYKQTILGCSLLFSFVATTITMPQSIVAAPTNYFAATAVTTCTLPDGTTGDIQADGHTCCPASDQSGTGSADMSCLFYKYINPAVALLSAAVAIVAVIAIIIGAIEYTSSAGDPQRSASGRKHITNALLGLFAYFLLYAFLQFIVPGGLFNG